MQEESSLKFAERLKFAMADSGLKAARLASDTGISKGYLSELLKGRKEAPSFEVVKKFADVLGCSPRWLLSGHVSPSSSDQKSAINNHQSSMSSSPELLALLERIAGSLAEIARKLPERE